MGVPLRNKQWLRIGGVVSVVLLLVYLMISMRSGAKLNEEKLGAAILKNRGLQDNFNKLTEELKRTVQRAAETRHELEKLQKSKELEVTRKDEQVKRCMSEIQEMKSKIQSVESDRDRVKSENIGLEEAKLEGAAEQEMLNKELEKLKLSSAKESEGGQRCKSDLDRIKAQLLSAQTDGLSASQELTECQGQLTIAESAYETCQTTVTSLEADNSNKQSEIKRLQLESNALKQQQIAIQKQAQLPRNGLPPRQPSFNDIDIANDQKQKTLAQLKQRLDSGHVLSKQEQQAFLMLTKDTGVESPLSKNKIILPIQKDKRDAANNQNPPPPKPGNPDEPQVEDLVVEEKNKKPENLDVKEDRNSEGGADGGDDDGDEQDPQNPQDYQRNKREFNDFNDEREADFNDRGDGGDFNGGRKVQKEFGNPLPGPVVKEPGLDPPNGGDTDIMDDPDGHEILKQDHLQFKKEWNEKHNKPGKRLPRQHREVR